MVVVVWGGLVVVVVVSGAPVVVVVWGGLVVVVVFGSQLRPVWIVRLVAELEQPRSGPDEGVRLDDPAEVLRVIHGEDARRARGGTDELLTGDVRLIDVELPFAERLRLRAPHPQGDGHGHDVVVGPELDDREVADRGRGRSRTDDDEGRPERDQSSGDRRQPSIDSPTSSLHSSRPLVDDSPPFDNCCVGEGSPLLISSQSVSAPPLFDDAPPALWYTSVCVSTCPTTGRKGTGYSQRSGPAGGPERGRSVPRSLDTREAAPSTRSSVATTASTASSTEVRGSMIRSGASGTS